MPSNIRDVAATERKRGNPGTPLWIRKRIWLLVEAHPDWPSKAIHGGLGRELEKLNKAILAPAERTVRHIMAQLGPLPEGDRDGPWSMGASAHYNIPAEASAELLKIWKWCMAVGRRFTIREAQWVSRLRGIVSPDSLLTYAAEYAAQERIGEAQNQPFLDSSGLDGHLVFLEDPDESNALLQLPQSAAAVGAGAVPESAFRRSDEDTDVGPHLSAGVAMEEALGLEMPGGTERPGSAIDTLYTLTLRQTSATAKWQHMSGEERQKAAQQLRNMVVETVTKLETELRDRWLVVEPVEEGGLRLVAGDLS